MVTYHHRVIFKKRREKKGEEQKENKLPTNTVRQIQKTCLKVGDNYWPISLFVSWFSQLLNEDSGKYHT